MSQELDYDAGIDVTLHFTKANVAENATTDLLWAGAGAGAGFKVPAGYKFHPILLQGELNANPSDGTATFKVIANSTELTNGPIANCTVNTQVAVAVARVGVEPIAAGNIVAVSVTTTANFAANTIDHDAVLIGKLLPA